MGILGDEAGVLDIRNEAPVVKGASESEEDGRGAPSFINDNIDFKRNCAPRESVQHGHQTPRIRAARVRVFKPQDVSTMMEKS